MKRGRKTEGSDSLRPGRYMRRREQSERRSINDLPDHLLMEILGRFGCPILTVRCKSVCKLWYSLISSPDFRIDPGFALIVNNNPALGQPMKEPHYASETSDLRKWRGFKLKYLPCFDGLRSVVVHASYKDLLLCAESCGSQMKFFIVNPFTMHWIDLPKTPACLARYKQPVGLAIKECPNEPLGYKFKVVRLIGLFGEFEGFRAEVFDPNINHWIEVQVYLPYGRCWLLTVDNALVYKGVLHWFDYVNGLVVAYDSFAPPDTNGRYTCRLIMPSDEMKYNGDVNKVMRECITLCEEHMRMVQLVAFPELLKQGQGNGAHSVRVWKLENYEEGRWVLEHRVYFKDMIFKSAAMQDKHIQAETMKFPPIVQECAGDCWFGFQKCSKTKLRLKPLACHPNNSHIVYLQFFDSIVSCNLFTKVLKMVSRIRWPNRFYGESRQVVPFLISSQPTPVPRNH